MSGIATGTALLIGGGMAAADGIGSAAMESSAAKNAANTQAAAARSNAQLQAQLGQESLGYQADQYGNSLALEEPYINSGDNALASLNYLLGTGSPGGSAGGGVTTGSHTLSIPGVSGSVTVPTVTGNAGTADTNLGAYGSLMAPYSGGAFTAPTAAQAAATPGYQFALQQGEGAVQAGAAANGSLLTGGTLNAENQYAQGLADTNYNNVYNQTLQAYNTNYNTWANQQANQFNRLSALAGMGQTSAQTLSNAGLANANEASNTMAQTGNAISQQNTNAAAATASGYMGSANAWVNGLSGATNNLEQLALVNAQMKSGKNSGNNSGQPLAPVWG